MSFTSTTLRNDYTATGSVADFTFEFPIFTKSDILVLAAGVLQTLDTHYKVLDESNNPFENVISANLPAKGKVRFIDGLGASLPPANGTAIALIPTQPLQQQSEYTTEKFPSERVERDFDKAIMRTRQNQEALVRALRAPQREALDLTLPNVASRKSLILGFDSNGLPTAVAVPTAGTGDGSLLTILATGSTTARTLAERYAQVYNVKDYGAKGDGVANDAPAIQAAIDAITASSIRRGVLFFPPGHYKTQASLTVNTDNVHIAIWGSGWMNTWIEHAGVASNGALYVTGRGRLNASGQTQPENASFVDIHDLSIGSTNGHGIYFNKGGSNARLSNLFIFSAGTSANTAYIRLESVFVMELSNIRLGGGNMGTTGLNSWVALPANLTSNAPPHALYGSNSSTSQVGEIHCHHVQHHATATGHAIRFETTGSGLAALFNLTFTDCEIKVDASLGSPNPWDIAAYLFDGAEATIVNSYSEAQGTPAMVRVKASFSATHVRLIGCTGNNGELVLDQSGGQFLKISAVSSDFSRIRLLSGASAYRIDTNDARFDNEAIGTPLIHGTGYYIGAIGSQVADSPVFRGGPAAGGSYTSIFPQYSDNSNAHTFLVQKGRGTSSVPTDVSANDNIWFQRIQGYRTGAFRTCAEIALKAQTVGSSIVEGVLVFGLADSAGSVGTALTLRANGPRFPVFPTGSLPAAGSDNNGLIIIEDVAAGDRNLIIYAGGQRFRIDGGAAV